MPLPHTRFRMYPQVLIKILSNHTYGLVCCPPSQQFHFLQNGCQILNYLVEMPLYFPSPLKYMLDEIRKFLGKIANYLSQMPCFEWKLAAVAYNIICPIYF